MKQLAGRIGISLIFIDGRDRDDTFTDSERSRVLGEIERGLSWISSYNREAAVEWVVETQRVKVDVADSTGDAPAVPVNTWAVPALRQLGARGDTPAGEYVEKLRERLGVGTAIVGYVTKFRGRSGANVGNIATWIRDAHRVDQSWVFPHEVLHLFGAPDEYRSAPTCKPGSCASTYGEFSVPNANCVNCTETPMRCLMRSQSTMQLCRWSVSHVGWDNPELEPAQRLAGRAGDLYGIDERSRLVHLEHTGWRTGADTWGVAEEIGGVGWGDHAQIHTAGNGILYAVGRGASQLHWHHHLGSDQWSDSKVRRLGSRGWHRLAACGYEGGLYVLSRSNKLLWYRHLDPEFGSDAFDSWRGAALDTPDLTDARQLLADVDGVIYVITSQGKLMWLKHEGWRSGADRWWSDGQLRMVSAGDWRQYRALVAAGEGIIYAERPNGDLHWYRHEGWRDGSDRWANGGRSTALSPPWT